MAINKGTLAKNVNGVMEYIYPKTTADIVEYTASQSVEDALNNLQQNKVNTSAVGAVNGIAQLDNTGKVVLSQLPSSVNNVIEGYLLNNVFYSDSNHTSAITPDTGKIYINLSDNRAYRYASLTQSFVAVSVVLGETSTTAYRGDRGKIAYDHSQITSGNPHHVTVSDIGLNNQDIVDALGYTPAPDTISKWGSI